LLFIRTEMVSPFAPNEPASILLAERASLGGYFVRCVAYGFEVCLYIMTILSMRRNWSVGNYRLQALFITWIFVLCSIDVGASLKAGVMATVDNRAFPADPETGNLGGPLGWSRVHYYITSNAIAGTTAYLMLASANAYLLFRFYVIYGSNKLYVLIPFALYLATIAFSVLLTLHSFATQTQLIKTVNTNLSLIFFSLDVTFNVSLTLLIVARVLYTKRSIQATLAKDLTKTYTSVATMLIESSALTSFVSIVFIACLNQSLPGGIVVISLIVPVATISPTLIAYRVSNGTSFTTYTHPLSAPMSFAPGETSVAQTICRDDTAFSINREGSAGEADSTDRDLEKN